MRGVVDQDEYGPEELADRCYRALQRRNVGEIARLEMHGRSRLGKLPHQGARGLHGDVDEGYLGVLRGELAHDRLADARAAAGDQNDLVLQVRINRCHHRVGTIWASTGRSPGAGASKLK